MEFIIIVIMLSPFLLALFAGIGFTITSLRGQNAAISKSNKTFPSDNNGNYPVIFDRASGTYITFNSGNASYPAQVFLIPNAPQNNTPKNYPRPILVNQGGYTVKDVTEQSEQKEECSGQLPCSEDVQPDIYNRLLEAKRGGKGKIKSIEGIAGFKRGSSKQYQILSELWEEMR